MPLYEMVIELLAGIGAQYVLYLYFLNLPYVRSLPSLTEALNTPIISPVMACLLTQGKRLLMVLASVISEWWLLGAASPSFLFQMVV